jgi:hypothetical protein
MNKYSIKKFLLDGSMGGTKPQLERQQGGGAEIKAELTKYFNRGKNKIGSSFDFQVDVLKANSTPVPVNSAKVFVASFLGTLGAISNFVFHLPIPGSGQDVDAFALALAYDEDCLVHVGAIVGMNFISSAGAIERLARSTSSVIHIWNAGQTWSGAITEEMNIKFFGKSNASSTLYPPATNSFAPSFLRMLAGITFKTVIELLNCSAASLKEWCQSVIDGNFKNGMAEQLGMNIVNFDALTNEELRDFCVFYAITNSSDKYFVPLATLNKYIRVIHLRKVLYANVLNGSEVLVNGIPTPTDTWSEGEHASFMMSSYANIKVRNDIGVETSWGKYILDFAQSNPGEQEFFSRALNWAEPSKKSQNLSNAADYQAAILKLSMAKSKPVGTLFNPTIDEGFFDALKTSSKCKDIVIKANSKNTNQNSSFGQGSSKRGKGQQSYVKWTGSDYFDIIWEEAATSAEGFTITSAIKTLVDKIASDNLASLTAKAIKSSFDAAANIKETKTPLGTDWDLSNVDFTSLKPLQSMDVNDATYCLVHLVDMMSIWSTVVYNTLSFGDLYKQTGNLLFKDGTALANVEDVIKTALDVISLAGLEIGKETSIVYCEQSGKTVRLYYDGISVCNTLLDPTQISRSSVSDTLLHGPLFIYK